jgi:hypothetical protein
MDLSVSPDLNALFCYAVVILLGLITAGREISNRLVNMPSRWIMVNTWLLFFAYWFLPVVLFWLLDRTNAIHDTSLFAAVLIGAGYQQILSGNAATIRPTGEISKFWKPFSAWADHVADGIRNRVARNDALFIEGLFADVVETEEKQKNLNDLAMAYSTNVSELQKALNAVQAQASVLGADGLLARRIRVLYEDLKRSAPLTWQFLLYEKKVISRWFYYWYEKEWRSKAAATVVATVLIIGAVLGLNRLWTSENLGRYYVWRLAKANATDVDHFRARQQLVKYLAQTEMPYRDLTDLLRFGGLPTKTAENILSLLVETRDSAAAHKANLPFLLADSLRTDNPDVRARIHDVLKYCGDERKLEIGDLRDWKPSAKDTSTDIDARVKEWKRVWAPPSL